MANETKIDTLSIDIDYSAGTANTGIDNLTTSLEKLQGITKGGISGLKTVKNQLENFVSASSGLNSIDLSKFSTGLSDISTAVKPLTDLGKTNLGNFVTQLKKIPDLNKSLDTKMISQFSKKIKDLSNAMLPLANNMAKVTDGFSSLPSKLNKVSNYTAKASKSVSLLSSISKLLNFSAIAAAAKMVGNNLSNFITSSNAYVENLNLFTVAMGESTDKAKKWIGTVTDALGIDPSGMMRYMGVFQMMATGFGLSSNAAYTMSKNLTQLTYDISSFYNIGIDEAAQKVQSALAGELEPVRRLGYALDQATLKQIAYNQGIEESFTEMSQAEKAQLRYIALLTQNQQVQGDMGRTIMSSANAIRVLKQQFTILGREIGNMFIPILMKVVPVAIAVVKVLSKVAKAIANLLGFELPDLNWDSVSIGADIGDGVADSLDDASGSAKRLKRQLAGFDELNNLTSPTPSSGSGADGGAGLPDFELDLPEYDMLEGFTKGIDDLTDKVMKFFGITEDSLGKLSWSWNDMSKEAKAAAVILGTIAGVKVLGSLTKGFNTLKTVFKALGSTKLLKWFKSLFVKVKDLETGITKTNFQWSKFITGIGKATTVIAGIVAVIDGLRRNQQVWNETIYSNEKSIFGLSKAQTDASLSALEMAAGGAAIGAAFGGLPGGIIGAVTGYVVALTQSIVNLKNAASEAVTQNLFGNLELTNEQLQTISNTITANFSGQVENFNSLISTIVSLGNSAVSSLTEIDTLIYSYKTLGTTLSGVTVEDLLGSIKTATEKSQELISETSDGIIKTLTQQWSKSTKLTENEQKEIVSIIQKSKQGKTTEVKEIEKNITNILETASNERRDLTKQEIEDIERYYNQLKELTSTELDLVNKELKSLVKNLTDNNGKLTKESWEKINETIEEKGDEATKLIEEDYQNQLRLASYTANQAYEEKLKETNNKILAQEEYDRIYNKLLEDAITNEEEKKKELNSIIGNLDKEYNHDAYAEKTRLFYDLINAENTYERTIAGLKYDAFNKDIASQLEYRKSYVSTAEGTGKQTASVLSKSFKDNIKWEYPQLPSLDGYNTGFNAGKDIAKGLYAGAKNQLSYSSLNLSAALNFNEWKTASNSVGSLSLRGFANGGFPSTGEFFIARESGPEMVGRIGNRTTVANNDQIVAGIQQGVYNAMINAQVGQTSNGTNVYIGNRQVYRSFSNGLKTENNRLGTSAVRV